MKTNTDIVIVNWNSGDQLLQCIESILEHGAELISSLTIVDNNSTDGSADKVKNLSKVNIIQESNNTGFAAACNVGAAVGVAPYILFLNPDTLLNSNSVSLAVSALDQDKMSKVGICGIQLTDTQGNTSKTCSRFPTLKRLVLESFGLVKINAFKKHTTEMSDWNHDESRKVDQVIGAFFLIRRALFEELHGFDERFFVYYEEVDLSFRASKLGWSSIYLTGASAFHAGGGTSRQVKAHRLFYFLRSRLLYGFKHFPKWQAWCLVGATGVIEPFTRTIWCLLNRDPAGVRHTWVAYYMLWRGMGKIVHGEGRFDP